MIWSALIDAIFNLAQYDVTCAINIGEKHLLVPTFLDNFHFSPYILFLSLLVPILKNASRFGPYRYIRNGESWRDKRQE